jgi:sodium/proline symporter
VGGFWAASVTDTVQGLLMATTAVVLPLAALAAIGGPAALRDSLTASGGGSLLTLTGETLPWAGVAFVLGTLGIGLGYPGQPHVVNRFMALRDDRALRQGRVIALLWAVVIYAGMILLGWSARVLFPASPSSEQVFFQAASGLLPPIISGVMIAAVLSAIMSTADSQLLVAASAVTQDLPLAGRRSGESLTRSRAVVLILSSMAIAIALYVPSDIFSRVLFAWHALGAAFGPLLILRLAGCKLLSSAILTAMAAGFGLTVIFHFLPEAPGDIIERANSTGKEIAIWRVSHCCAAAFLRIASCTGYRRLSRARSRRSRPFPGASSRW